MKAFFAGVTSNFLRKVLGCDLSIPLLITDDYGVPLDVEDPVVITVQLFLTSARSDTPDASFVVDERPGVLGYADLVIPDTAHGLTRAQHWAWVKRDDAGDVCYSDYPSTLLFV